MLRGRIVGESALVVPPTFVLLVPDEQVIVTAAEGRGAQRTYDGKRIRGIVDRSCHQHEIPDLTGSVHE